MWEEEEEKKKPPGAAPAPGRAGRAAPRCLFSATFPVVCNIEFVFFSFIFVFFFSPLPLLLSLSLSLHSDPFAVGAFFGLYSFPSLPSPSPPPHPSSSRCPSDPKEWKLRAAYSKPLILGIRAVIDMNSIVR